METGHRVTGSNKVTRFHVLYVNAQINDQVDLHTEQSDQLQHVWAKRQSPANDSAKYSPSLDLKSSDIALPP